jgi:hypothetical protein
MRNRWRLILPVIGLLLFAGVTVEAFHRRHFYQKDPGRYLYWSAIRLDSDPRNRRPQIAAPCKDAGEGCVSWDPVVEWASPGLLPGLLMLSACPAFIVGLRLVRALGRHGVSEVSSFMAALPVLIAGWYYTVGGLVDHWRSKRRNASSQSERRPVRT